MAKIKIRKKKKLILSKKKFNVENIVEYAKKKYQFKEISINDMADKKNYIVTLKP
jgi:hypothetical protein